MIFSKIKSELYIYIIYYISFNIQRGFSQLGDIIERGFQHLGKIAGCLLKLKGNYIYIMYLSILKEAFIIWGDSCSNVLHKINIVCSSFISDLHNFKLRELYNIYMYCPK